ncbi:MAG: 50S ribosomal protein L3 [bacterium]|nr:50S ribosomal protein L3 [bacterium]
MNTLLATKSEMTSRYDSKGKRLTVTSVIVADNFVVEKKTTEKAGYEGLVLGTGHKKGKNKALTNKVQGYEGVPLHIKEIRGEYPNEVGTFVKLSEVFAEGDLVKVTGISKGKGFTGVVKRYNFRGGPKTHGQSDRHRAPGSLGSGTTPGRVFKGKRMAGRSGGETATVRNLTVIYVNDELKKLFLSGPIPGHKTGLLTITKIGENKKFSGMELLVSDIRKVVANDEVIPTAQIEETESETNEVVEVSPKEDK